MSNPFGIPFRSGKQIRDDYIQFFKDRGHQFVRSSPVVPHDDPTLLFINSGMNQFKSIFLGDNRDGLKRAVNSQKCLRVSGKHNDLDEVGRDTYHQTLFEMLGNWSFGDYYKKEAIMWAWELLTEVWQLPKDRLFVTVYNDDDEAAELWEQHTDIEPWRIMRFDEKDNFWEMGDVGPCGPCSEINFDLGDDATRKDTYNDPVKGVNGEDGRYVEVWNLVFMQYERMQDGSLKPLKDKHVDTGMGFERICSVIQGSGSNYETDVLQPLLQKIAELTGVPYDAGDKGVPHRVIADHVRALAFSIADGATPGNEGRGYVLRRILRRASRFSQELGQTKPFIYQLTQTVADVMGEAFPEVVERQDYIAQVIQAEEERFMRTLKDGLQRFHKLANEVKKKKKSEIPGKDVFTLYDTYGFPVDLTGMLAEEQGLTLDQAGFEKHMEEQRERARGASKFDGSLASDEGWTILDANQETEFTGYNSLSGDVQVRRYCEVGDDILVCLDRSPFYAEAGGQVGDVGHLVGEGIELKVTDTFKLLEMHVHRCSLVNGLVNEKTMTKLKASVDSQARAATIRNHSATHLLHAALRDVLGDHVAQQGSRVSPEGLRFDFTHQTGLSDEELTTVENLVNEEVLKNHGVAIANKSMDQAKADGAIALFGEKYGDEVRTIKMGEFSHELCGGTHVQATGEIGLVKITSESSIAAGVRRIEAVTGLGALELARRDARLVYGLSQSLKVKPEGLASKLQESQEATKALEKELKQFRQKQAANLVGSLINEGETKGDGTKVIISSLSAHGVSKDMLQSLVEDMASRLDHGVAVLTYPEPESLSIMTAVGKPTQKKIRAGDLVKQLATVADGRGGGRPDRAQAGSKHPDKEPTVLAEAKKILGELFGA